VTAILAEIDDDRLDEPRPTPRAAVLDSIRIDRPG
jgi:hypothetical protein